MRSVIKTLILSFLSGIAISIGGCVFLACESRYMGALAFSVGLFFTVEFGFKLYTGAIGYALENNKKDNLSLITILVGNFLGTLFIGLILQLSRFENGLQEKAEALSLVKLNDTWYSILILSFMCGILIYAGVDTYKKSQNNVSKVLAILMCVFVFIVCGFEHCVANMFYFVFSNSLSAKCILYILIMVIGNSLGGLLIPGLKKIIVKLG